MSGFEASVAPVGVKVHEPPRGLARLEAATRAHLDDLARHGLGPKAKCDVCGNQGGRWFDRDRLREVISCWISLLCPRCETRFERRPQARPAASPPQDFD